MNLAVIIAAAGSSSRYTQALRHEGVDAAAVRSKLDEDLGGRPVLQRTVELFANHPATGSIIVAGPHDEQALAQFKAKYADKLGLLGAKVVRGGAEHRWQTIASALAHVAESTTHVAVHDGARPCASPGLIDRLLDAAQRHRAVVPGVSMADTLKRVGPPLTERVHDPLAAILGTDADHDAPATDAPRPVLGTVDRDGLVAVQTPQVFERDVLVRAYGQGDLSGTDDAQLVERLGVPVVVVPGEPTNIKVTVPADLALARLILNIKVTEGRAAHKRF